MNLLEAIKSGRPWRRVGDKGDWNPAIECSRYSFPREALFAEYETQEPTITITASQLYAALAEVLKECDDANVFFSVTRSRMDPIKELARRLGLEPTE